MNTANTRMKYLRKELLGMTTIEFGKVLGISNSGVSDIESGRRNVTDQHLRILETQDIKGMRVNTDWLRTGEGEPFVEKTRSEQIREYFSRLDGLSENFKDRFADALAALDENDWEIIDELVDRLKKQGRGNRAREEERQRLHADIDRQLDEKGSQGAGRSASTSGLQGTAG